MTSLFRRLRRSQDKSNADLELACEGFSILLPADHALPTYLRQYPRYDRFLPHLAKFLPARAGVIDVGANCGDTLAAMVPGRPDARFLCVEADPEFFGYLERNVARMKTAWPDASVALERALVGRAVGRVRLEGGAGSRHAEPDENGMASCTLDAIVERLRFGAVTLLKSDVDGYDYDVLDSASAVIASDAPLLFFECQPPDADKRAAFARTLDALAAAGYTHWAAFDNFGEVMLRATEPRQIVQLMEYVGRMDQGGRTRTIYYVDVLAATARHAAVLEASLQAY